METRRIAIVDRDGGFKLANVVESTAVPGIFGLIALNPDGSTIAGNVVNSVSNIDGTLTISPTTGNVIASLNLGHANIRTGKQEFSIFPANFSYATASTVPYLDASKDLVSSAITPTELGYLSGTTSNIQSQINLLVGGVSYQGTWNATTNTPTLASGVGTKGYYYVVSVAGSTNLDGITDWKIDDWAIFNGTAWEKVDNTDAVTSVFGRTGAVVAVAGDYDSDLITNVSGVVGATVSDALDTLESTKQDNLTGGANEILYFNSLGTSPTSDPNFTFNQASDTLEVNKASRAGGGNTTVDFQNEVLYSSNRMSIDWMNRQGYNAGNRIIFGWDPNFYINNIPFNYKGYIQAALLTADRYYELPDQSGTFALTADLASYVQSVSGTANRITSTGGQNPVIDISATYVGQTSITTLGTITTGTWNATTIAANRGGTGFATYAVGDLLYANTTSTLAKLADVAVGSYLRSGGVNTAPLWSTLTLPNSSSQGDIFYSSAANAMTTLAKDTNATRYLSNTGTSNNPARSQVNLTNGVTGTLPFANGGTGNTAFTSGSVPYSNGTIFTQNNAGFYFSGTSLGVGTNNPDQRIHSEQESTFTNRIVYPFRVTHTTTSTATTNFGVGIEYELENGSGTNILAGKTDVSWSDATATSEDATLTRRLMRGATLTAQMTLSSLGLLNPVNILLNAGAAAAGGAPIKLTSGTNLTTPEAGAMEYDGTYLYFTPTGTIRKTLPTIVKGRSTSQTGAVATVVSHTVGGADASYQVSANLLVNSGSSYNFTVTCAYTDEGNTARTLTMNFTLLAGGTLFSAVKNANGNVPYMGFPNHIRCKSGTTITIATTGTFTTVNYNVEGQITLI